MSQPQRCAIAIETSSRIGSVALVHGDSVIAEQTFAHGLQHAAEMLPQLDRLCRAQGWSPRDLTELFLSIGPGSFTGLRIAVAMAKSLALATGVKLVAVPSLRVLVENAPPSATHAVAALDAKRGQVYAATFHRAAPPPRANATANAAPGPVPATSEGPGDGRKGDNGGKGDIHRFFDNEKMDVTFSVAGASAGPGVSAATGPSASVDPGACDWIETEPPRLDTLEAILSRSPRPVHLIGDAIAYHRDALDKHDPGVILAPEETWRPQARTVARLGIAMAAAGLFTDPMTLRPLYIRRPEAEEKWEAR